MPKKFLQSTQFFVFLFFVLFIISCIIINVYFFSEFGPISFSQVRVDPGGDLAVAPALGIQKLLLLLLQ